MSKPRQEPFKISAPYVVIGEGKADAAFLRQLTAMRQLPKFDLWIGEVQGTPSGSGAFGHLLRRLANESKLDPSLMLHGVIVMADAADRPDETLREIGQHCAAAGFGRVTTAGIWSDSPPPLPPIALILVPHDGAGGIETLCLRSLRPRYPVESACLDSFFACLPRRTGTSEQRDKAALAMLTAAINQAKPVLPLHAAFADDPLLIDVGDPAFGMITNQFMALLDASAGCSV